MSLSHRLKLLMWLIVVDFTLAFVLAVLAINAHSEAVRWKDLLGSELTISDRIRVEGELHKLEEQFFVAAVGMCGVIVIGLVLQMVLSWSIRERVLSPVRVLHASLPAFSGGGDLRPLRRLAEQNPGDELTELAEQFVQVSVRITEQIAERDRLVRERQDQEDRLETLMDAVGEGVWDWNVQTGTVYRSPSYYRMLGFEPDGFGSELEVFFDLLHPDDHERLWRDTHGYLDGTLKEYRTVEVRLKNSDGEYRLIRSQGTIRPDPLTGLPHRIIGVHVDVTDQRLNELRLLDSDQKLQGIKLALADEYLLFSLDRDGRLVDVAESVRNVLGFSPAEASVSFRELLTDNPDNEQALAQLTSALAGEPVSPTNGEMRDKDGKPHAMEIFLFPARNAQLDGSVAVEGVALDLTRHRTIQTELQAAWESSTEANRAKDEVLSNLSHELRTPLNGLLGMLQLLLHESDLSPSNKSRVGDALDAGDYLIALVEDALELARLDTGRFEPNWQIVRIRETLEAAARMVRKKALEQALKLTVDVAADVPEFLWIDPQRTKQIVINLLGNAVKFTPEGAVRLEAFLAAEPEHAVEFEGRGGQPLRSAYGTPLSDDPEELWLVIQVIDTGVGISSEEAEVIFEAYRRAGTLHRRGVGLGLAISRRHAMNLGGTLEVESEKGAGSTFELRLPARGVNGDVPETAAQASWSERDLRTLSPGQSAEVLIVDDETANRQVLREFLTAVGFTVREAAGGEAAIDVLRSRSIPLILMDEYMPVLLGSQAVRRIREQSRWDDVVVIVLSAGASIAMRDSVLAAGAQSLVAKPVSFDHLLNEIERLTPLQFVKPVAVPEPVRKAPADGVVHGWEQASRVAVDLRSAAASHNFTRLRSIHEEVQRDSACPTDVRVSFEKLFSTFDFNGLIRLADTIAERFSSGTAADAQASD